MKRFSVPDLTTKKCNDCEPHEPKNRWSYQIKLYLKKRVK